MHSRIQAISILALGFLGNCTRETKSEIHASGSSFEWTRSGCQERTASGKYRLVNEEYCERVAPTTYAWDSDGCGQVTPNHLVLRRADERKCEELAPSIYVWTSDGCEQRTPNGYWLRKAEERYCEQVAPSEFRKTSDGCFQYTPDGKYLRRAEDYKCQY